MLFTIARPARPIVSLRAMAPWQQVTACWLGSRVVLLLVTVLAAHSLTPASLAHQWVHWDALWYLRIAEQGYTSAPATAFFPLYPLLIRLMTPLALGHPLLAALLISNGAALLAALGIARLASNLWPERPERGIHSAVLLLTSPLAFFLAAPYSDSLFLAAVAWALATARERRWWLACGCGLVASLTHVTGILLIAPLMWEFAASLRHGWSWGSVATGSLAVGAPAFSLDLYSAYLRMRFGDGLLFLHVEVIYYLRRPMAPWQSVALACTDLWQAILKSPISFPVIRQLIDDLPVALAVCCALALWRLARTPAPGTIALFTLLLVWSAISAPATGDPRNYVPWLSCGRYMLTALAIPLTLAAWIDRSRHARVRCMALLLGSLALQLILLAFFFRPDAAFGLV